MCVLKGFSRFVVSFYVRSRLIFFNFSLLNTTVLRKVFSFPDISAVNLMVRWNLLAVSSVSTTLLLNVATKGQLFQFNGALYEQTDGVTMGSPLGPLLANVFMSHIEENLEREGKTPFFLSKICRRYAYHHAKYRNSFKLPGHS